MRRIGNGNNRSRSRTRPRSEKTQFLCNLVLLNGPDSITVPRQGTRVVLMENGHMLSSCSFSKDMNEVQVEATILEAFPDKIPPLTDIEILTSVYWNAAERPAAVSKRSTKKQEKINSLPDFHFFKYPFS